MNSDDSRKRFEEWYEERYTAHSMSYKERCWHAWQARGDADLESMIKLLEKEIIPQRADLMNNGIKLAISIIRTFSGGNNG